MSKYIVIEIDDNTSKFTTDRFKSEVLEKYISFIRSVQLPPENK